MKKSVVHKLLSSTLAFLVVFSTFSFTIDKHFCGEYLVDTAIFSEAKGCGMEVMDTSITEAINKSCCQDTVEVVKGQDDLKLSDFEGIKNVQKQLVICYLSSYQLSFEYTARRSRPFDHYKPPNLICDIALLDEVFLI